MYTHWWLMLTVVMYCHTVPFMARSTILPSDVFLFHRRKLQPFCTVCAVCVSFTETLISWDTQIEQSCLQNFLAYKKRWRIVQSLVMETHIHANMYTDKLYWCCTKLVEKQAAICEPYVNLTHCCMTADQWTLHSCTYQTADTGIVCCSLHVKKTSLIEM